MISYCIKSEKDMESINPKDSKTSTRRKMLLSKPAVYDS